MKKNTLVSIVVVILALAIGTPAALASLNQQFDFGDVRGGFGTFVDDRNPLSGSQLSASLAVSSGTIDSVSVSIWPELQLNMDGKSYFSIDMYFSGNYDTSPASMDGLSQSLSASHRGISITESSFLSSYQDYRMGDTDGTPTGAIFSNSSSNVALFPFTVIGANGNFNDNSWYDPYMAQTRNDFWYGVIWTGYTTNATVATMLSNFGSVQLQSPDVRQTPEPATMALLGLGGLLLRRNRK